MANQRTRRPLITQRKTKIIATIGPASSQAKTIRAMIAAGVDIFRLNFSHIEYADCADVIATIRAISADLDTPTAILADLSGPKIRVGIVTGDIRCKVGATVTLTEGERPGAADAIPVTCPGLVGELSIGDRILINDGIISLEVVSIDGRKKEVAALVKSPGIVTTHKGVNLPDTKLSVKSFTEKDEHDLAFALDHGVDFVALSFVRSASDVDELRNTMVRLGSPVPIVAKIEKAEAVDDIDRIVAASDAIMVARGDLGVEIEYAKIPAIQKEIIHAANLAGKPVILATEILTSMIDSTRPTRAEATDVANGIFDGIDALMLSNETTVGRHPILAVDTLAKIALEAEKSIDYHLLFNHIRSGEINSIERGISHSAVLLANELGAHAIISFTYSGKTSGRVARYRPAAPIYALSPNDRVLRTINIYRGVFPSRISQQIETIDQMAEIAEEFLTDMLAPGEIYVLTAGTPLGLEGKTNLIRVDTKKGKI